MVERIQLGRSAKREISVRGKNSFQINIRHPLPQLTPRQATHYLGRISEALPILAGRAAKDIEDTDAQKLARGLEEAARVLRGAP